jgi:hypothetical protein
VDIKVDDRVATIMEFMERNYPADKLLELARAVMELAPVMWGPGKFFPYEEPVRALSWVGSHRRGCGPIDNPQEGAQ